MKRVYCYFTLIVLCFFAFTTAQAYEKPADIDKETWYALKPHFLPEDHPIKKKLDRIFEKARASYDEHSLKKAGFSARKPRTNTQMTVARHPDLEGYLLKLVMDTIDRPEEWYDWRLRIAGAQVIRDSIIAHKFNHIMKVPNKWIYPLPLKPEPPTLPSYAQRKYFILVVEDMNIVDHDENYFLWGSIAMTYEMMDAIYIVFEECGLYDSVFPFNVPFSEDGRLAFIDTEWYHDWPIKYERLTKYFPAHMREYWEAIVENGGPSKETEHLKKDIWD